jgi:hypothetical protein
MNASMNEQKYGHTTLGKLNSRYCLEYFSDNLRAFFCGDFIIRPGFCFGKKETGVSGVTLNNFQNYIITNHYQFTTPLSSGDMLWKDNPFNPVT